MPLQVCDLTGKIKVVKKNWNILFWRGYVFEDRSKINMLVSIK
jgi:hypothetical protein